MERERREHSKPLPEPDLRRTASDRQRGYGTPQPDADPADPADAVEGVEHEPEPDAENIMPAEDRPGTL